MANPYRDSRHLRESIAAETGGTCILSFSRGKDSLAAWLALREQFDRVLPFYMYRVPGLSWVEESLAYYEDFFQTPIMRVPHPATYNQIRSRVYQPPWRWEVIEEAARDGRLPRLSYQGQEVEVRKVYGNWPVAWGTRAKDSPLRMGSIRRHGPVNHTRRTFWCIWDWGIAEVCDIIRKHRVKMAADYRMFGRSFDGLDYRYTKHIREKFPEDYERIKQWFPMVDADLFRHEAGQHSLDEGFGWAEHLQPKGPNP